MQNINKWMLTMIIGAVAAVSVLFLPYMAAFGVSFSAFTLMTNHAPFIFVLAIIISILGAAAMIYSGYVKKKQYALYSGIAGVAGLVISLFTMEGAPLDQLLGVLGFGFWLAIIAFVAGIIVAIKMPE